MTVPEKVTPTVALKVLVSKTGGATTTPERAIVALLAPSEERIRLPERLPAGAELPIRTKIGSEALPPDCGIVAEGPNVELSEETSKGAVAFAVMLAVRFVPLAVRDWTVPFSERREVKDVKLPLVVMAGGGGVDVTITLSISHFGRFPLPEV